ncbi:MAG: hypothetical protein R3F61_10165 [Myxococcota bacterium]
MPSTRAIAVLLAGAVATVVAAAGVWMFVRPPPAPGHRPVRVQITGVPEGGEVVVREHARVLLPDQDAQIDLGSRATDARIRLDWTLGPGCSASCPDRCPAWCANGFDLLEVPRGEGTWVTTIEVSPPEDRDVTLVTSGPLSRAALDTRAGRLEGRKALFGPTRPGPYEALLEIGPCPPEAFGCASSGEVCPVGCTSWVQQIAIPAGEGPVDLALTLPLPNRPEPVAAPTPRATRDQPVSGAEFARFVDGHPAWSRDAAIASGAADSRYLKGWSPGPPPGPVTQVTWNAAVAYCADKGGLRGLDAAPLTWDRASGATQEWRDDGGSPAWRRFDGEVSKRAAPDRAFSFTGFRCGG